MKMTLYLHPVIPVSPVEIRLWSSPNQKAPRIIRFSSMTLLFLVIPA
jgi:hypothetical protein